MSRQDPATKNDPYSARFAYSSGDHDAYHVKSASSGYTYLTVIGRDGDTYASCTCPAHKVCWHIEAARLRRQCDRAYTNSANRYRALDLNDARLEEAILIDLLADADSWLVRAQYGGLGDRIAELLATEAAA